MYIDNFKTQINESHMAQAVEIPIKDIDIGEKTQSREKGLVTEGKKGYNSNLASVTQSIRNRISQGKPPLAVPAVVERLENGKWSMVLGHHRIRGSASNELETIKSVVTEFASKAVKRRFQKYNNDHPAPAEPNSRDDVQREIDDTIRDLVSQGYDLDRDKKEIRLRTWKEVEQVFANNWSPSRIENLVNKTLENVTETFPDAVQKFKAYDAIDAFEAARGIYNKPEITAPGESHPLHNEIIYAANLSKGGLEKYYGYAVFKIARALAEKKPVPKFYLACYFQTATLNEQKDLLRNRRSYENKIAILNKGLKQLFKQKYAKLFEEVIWLPQYMGDDAPEKEDAKLPAAC